MASSRRTVGRVRFVLQMLLLTALVVAVERLLQYKAIAHPSFLPPFLHDLPRVTCYCLFAQSLGSTIQGRLLDARLPRWCFWPVFLVWIFSTLSIVPGEHLWPALFALNLFVLIAGGIIPSKPAPVEFASENGDSDGKLGAPASRFPDRLTLGPIGFLRSLLTIGCLWLPLIWLEDTSADDLGSLVARAGYFVLGVVWLINTIRRFEDAGRSSQWYGLLYFSMPIVSMVPLWLKLINGYESLLLFVLIQLPFAMLRSKPKSAEPVVEEAVGSEALMDAETKDHEIDRQPTQTQKRRRVRPISPKGFLVTLLVIACLWSLMIYLDGASGGGIGSWIAWIGYMLLVFSWFGNVARRLKDAGWAHGILPAQYCIVILVATLMPHAVHWVNGYEALAIFVLIQIPTVLLPSKPRPEERRPIEDLPEDNGAEVDEDCLRDPWEGMRASHTGEQEISYQRPKRGFLKDRGLGVSNWAPKRRQY